LLFLIIFIWTPPHFWALALYKAGDYGKVGIPMMPNVRGAKSTRLQIFVYSLLLAAVSLAPVITGLGGTIYAFAALLLNVGFLALAFKVWRSRAGEKEDAADEASLYAVAQGDRAARNLFLYSILYLFALFGLLYGIWVLFRQTKKLYRAD
jgi:protoheme IX farnesyltransferase